MLVRGVKLRAAYAPKFRPHGGCKRWKANTEPAAAFAAFVAPTAPEFAAPAFLVHSVPFLDFMYRRKSVSKACNSRKVRIVPSMAWRVSRSVCWSRKRSWASIWTARGTFMRPRADPYRRSLRPGLQGRTWRQASFEHGRGW